MMRKDSRYFSFLNIAVAVLFAGACSAELPEPRAVKKGDRAYVREHLDKLIRARMKNHDLEALSIALVSGNETIMARGYGRAKFGKDVNNAQDKKVDAHTVYAAASISKIFTAVAIMRLAEQGKLDIHAPVQKILPWFPHETITPAALMSHRSGLPGNVMNGFTHVSEPPPMNSLVPLLSKLPLSQDDIKRPVYRYSNLGFAVLGLIIEKITRRPFADYMRHEILLPLGMRDSGFGLRAARNPRTVLGNRNGDVVPVPIPRDLAAGALLTSVADLGEFMKSLLANNPKATTPRPPITHAGFQAMLRPQNRGVPRDAGYEIGLAWFRNSFGLKQGGRKAGHAGDLPPYHAFMLTLPDHGLGVAILCNSEGSQAPIIYTAIAALELALQSEKGIAPAAAAKSETIQLKKETMDRIAGHYATGMGLIRVRREGDALRTPLFGIPMELTPLKDGTFQPAISVLGLFTFRVADLEPLRLRFPEAKPGTGSREHSLALKMSDFLVTSGARVKPAPIAAAWKKRLGEYRIVNQSGTPIVGDFNLLEKDGYLMVSAKLLAAKGLSIEMPLRTLSDERARVLGTGEFIQANRRGLMYSGYVLEKKSER